MDKARRDELLAEMHKLVAGAPGKPQPEPCYKKSRMCKPVSVALSDRDPRWQRSIDLGIIDRAPRYNINNYIDDEVAKQIEQNKRINDGELFGDDFSYEI